MIYYRSGYKYQLAKDYSVLVRILPDKPVKSEFIRLTATGKLTIKKGYAWDGPSGPSIDTKSFMRGSLVHDALYQLMREKSVAQDQRIVADEILREICLEDGMNPVRAWWVYHGVRLGGAEAAKPNDEDEPVLSAP